MTKLLNITQLAQLREWWPHISWANLSSHTAAISEGSKARLESALISQTNPKGPRVEYINWHAVVRYY